MNAFLDFSARPHWDPQALAQAVPVRLRLHQLFAFDATRAGPLHASANREAPPRRAWRQHEYASVCELPRLFRVC
jgi:hypothetical protein